MVFVYSLVQNPIDIDKKNFLKKNREKGLISTKVVFYVKSGKNSCCFVAENYCPQIFISSKTIAHIIKKKIYQIN